VQPKPLIRIAPNNPVFDLPVIVGIEEGLFDARGLDVRFSGTYADREKDRAERPIMSRLKEQMFDCGSADSYNVCEWASIDRLERGTRAGHIAALRAAVAAQAILTFDDALQVPRDLADVPVVVQELTGSHYCTVQMLESAIGAEHVKIERGGLPQARWAALKNRTSRVVTLMERSNVETVIVAGKVRKWQGRLLDVDLRKLRSELEASRDYLFKAAGVKTDLFRA